MQANINDSSQTNILSLCPYSLMINQISKDTYIHLNNRELKARYVNRRSTTQCNATSRIRYTVLFGINVQDTIKYLPFDMSGTVAESVTDATLLFTKTRKKFCKHIPEKCSIWCYTVKCHNYFSLFPALLEQKNSCSGLKKYIIPSSKDQFQH